MKKNIYFIIAGLINLFTAFVHLIGGQLSLVDPMLDGSMTIQAKTEWLGCWHVISIILFASAIYILLKAFKGYEPSDHKVLKLLGYLYIAMSLPFIIVSFIMGALAPQWILLLPIGLLVLVGLKRMKTN